MKRKSRPTIGPVEFIDRVIKRDEKGEPFRLAPYQRRVLKIAAQARSIRRAALSTGCAE